MLIRAVQRMLRDQGCDPGPIDGDWGSLTQAAMDAFQRGNGVSVPQWLVVAERELGIHEIAGSKSEKRIIEYHQHTSLKASEDEVPWCSSFANYCVDIAGLHGTNSAAAASWAGWGKKCQPFQYGVICVFTRPGGNHVGFGLWQDVTHIAVLGGNQSDRVCVALQPRDRLLALRWPISTS